MSGIFGNETINDESSKNENSELEKEVIENTGLESKQINDFLLYHESEEQGGIIIKAVSDSMFEEDLSQMEKHKGLLDEQTYEKITKESFIESLKTIGQYIPSDKLARLFPGIELSRIDSYDFSDAKIKVFVLSKEDFNDLYKNLYQKEENDKGSGFTMPSNRFQDRPPVKSEMQVDLSEKRVIVISELPPSASEMFKKFNYNDEEKKKIISTHVENVIVHEFIHVLGISSDLPRYLNEGITECYSQWITSDKFNDPSFIETRGLFVGYPNETQFFSILMDAMVESGIDEVTIHKAFLSSDAQSRKQINDFLSQRYGQEKTEKIMDWDFKSSREALQYIVDLEAKQDSEIGRFLKTYKKY